MTANVMLSRAIKIRELLSWEHLTYVDFFVPNDV